MEENLRRFWKAVEYLRDSGVIHSQQNLADDLKLSKQNMSSIMKGDPKRFTMGFLKRFASTYSHYINEAWLFYGDGEMEYKDPHKFKPNVPIRVAAGFVGGCVEEALISGCEILPTIPFLPQYDFTIRVMGDSMLPTLEDGDVVACRYLDDIISVKDDKIYVVDTREGAVVKKLRLNDTELVCTSISPKYETYTIKTSAVIKVAQVVSILRNC